uniref:Glycosyltransferase RgtA/B/C/D-like domain-containing protein n=1 Tax=Desulfobacca acetoxidans TaxID=60893 RepID=A0A7C3SJW8_9BACT
MSEEKMHRLNKVIVLYEKHQKVIISMLAAILLTGGICFSIFLGDNLKFADEKDYLRIANNLSTKHIYSIDGVNPTAFRSPGYPLILYGILQLGVSIVTIRIFNYIALSISLILFYKLLKKIGGAISGGIGAFLICFYPVLFFTAGMLYPQAVAIALFILILYLLIKNIESDKFYYFLICGLLYGYLILIHPLFLLNLPVIISYPFLLGQKKKLIKAFIFFLSSLIVISFWVYRNSIIAFGLNNMVQFV